MRKTKRRLGPTFVPAASFYAKVLHNGQLRVIANQENAPCGFLVIQHLIPYGKSPSEGDVYLVRGGAPYQRKWIPNRLDRVARTHPTKA